MAELVDLNAAQSLLAAAPEGLVILDVRTDDEFGGGHINGAINMDVYDDAFSAGLDGLDRTVPYLVYCKAGGRSAKACELMASLGFEQVSDMTAGWDGWADAGFGA